MNRKTIRSISKILGVIQLLGGAFLILSSLISLVLIKRVTMYSYTSTPGDGIIWLFLAILAGSVMIYHVSISFRGRQFIIVEEAWNPMGNTKLTLRFKVMITGSLILLYALFSLYGTIMSSASLPMALEAGRNGMLFLGIILLSLIILIIGPFIYVLMTWPSTGRMLKAGHEDAEEMEDLLDDLHRVNEHDTAP